RRVGCGAAGPWRLRRRAGLGGWVGTRCWFGRTCRFRRSTRRRTRGWVVWCSSCCRGGGGARDGAWPSLVRWRRRAVPGLVGRGRRPVGDGEVLVGDGAVGDLGVAQGHVHAAVA